jgi:hypothetical protein
MKTNDFTIKFMDKEGSLIVNRITDSEHFIKPNGTVDKEMVSMALEIESRIKGVMVISSKVDKNGITAIVDYL